MAGGVERLRKVRRLEGRAADVAASVSRLEEVRRDYLLSAALSRLDADSLAALGPLIDAALEQASPGTTTDLYQYAATKRDRLALRALAGALVAVKDQELTKGASHA